MTVGRMPVWAPDGSRLLVVDEMQLRLVDTTGQVLGTLGSGAAPAWSRDGSRIAFVTDAGIAVMNADGTGGRTILPHLFRTDTWPPGDMGVGSPTWSPDGRRIAFEHLGDGDTRMAQVFVMNADGSDPRPLVQFSSAQYGEGDPSWSPDGAWIAIWNWWYGLARVPAIGGVPTTLYRNFPAVSWGTRPAWSPDGTSIAFTANWFTPNKPEIWAIPAMGGLPVRLVYDGYQPAWSPDGRRIAFGRMVVP